MTDSPTPQSPTGVRPFEGDPSALNPIKPFHGDADALNRDPHFRGNPYDFKPSGFLSQWLIPLLGGDRISDRMRNGLREPANYNIPQPQSLPFYDSYDPAPMIAGNAFQQWQQRR